MKIIAETATPQYPETLTALQTEQSFLVFIAAQLADAASRTDSRSLSCATGHVLIAITSVHDAAEALATAVSS